MTDFAIWFGDLHVFGKLVVSVLIAAAVFAIGSMFTLRLPPPGLGQQ